jgi:hypothetical protein
VVAKCLMVAESPSMSPFDPKSMEVDSGRAIAKQSDNAWLH